MRILCACKSMAVCFILSNCANLTTIDRTTNLPSGKDEDSGGIAIHLDARQRLAISKKFGAFCAEPNPDVFGTTSSAIGLGVSVPAKGSASGTQSLSDSAASIGLRTQTITLMRDAMYRICELYYGRALNGTTATQLHRGYMDNLVAMLAVEQLTGAVKAEQAALTGNAASSGNAGTGGNPEQLEEAKKSEKTTVDKAKTQRQLANAKRIEYTAADDGYRDALQADGTPQTTIDQLFATRQQKFSEWQAADNAAFAAEAEAIEKTAYKKGIEDGVSGRSATSATSLAGARSQFSGAIANKLSETATKEVADAVKKIVLSVLNKDHAANACMAFLTDRGSPLYKTAGFNNKKEGDQLAHKRAAEVKNKRAAEVKNMCIKLMTRRGFRKLPHIHDVELAGG